MRYGGQLLCVLFLVGLCTLPAYAAQVVVDGDIRPYAEYNGNSAILQDHRYESNCSVDTTYIHWLADPPNNSLYLAIQYESEDFDVLPDLPEDQIGDIHLQTAIEITINDKLCCTIYPNRQSFADLSDDRVRFFADGYSTDLDTNRYALENKWYFVSKISPGAHCEMRLGLRYWQGEDLIVGVRVFDFHGVPSNYHTVRVYERPTTTTTTQPETTTASQRTTRQTTTSTTRETKTTTEKRTQTSTRKPTPTARYPRLVVTSLVTDPRFVSPPATESAAESLSVKETAIVNVKKQTSEKAKSAARIKATAANTTTEGAQTIPTSGSTQVAQAAEDVSTEPQTSFAVASRESGIRQTTKTVGIAAASSLVTGAVMFSAFSMGRRYPEEADQKNHNSDTTED